MNKQEEAERMLDDCMKLSVDIAAMLPRANPLLVGVCKDIADGVHAANERIRRFHEGTGSSPEQFDTIVHALRPIVGTLKAIRAAL